MPGQPSLPAPARSRPQPSHPVPPAPSHPAARPRRPPCSATCVASRAAATTLPTCRSWSPRGAAAAPCAGCGSRWCAGRWSTSAQRWGGVRCGCRKGGVWCGGVEYEQQEASPCGHGQMWVLGCLWVGSEGGGVEPAPSGSVQAAGSAFVCSCGPCWAHTGSGAGARGRGRAGGTCPPEAALRPHAASRPACTDTHGTAGGRCCCTNGHQPACTSSCARHVRDVPCLARRRPHALQSLPEHARDEMRDVRGRGGITGGFMMTPQMAPEYALAGGWVGGSVGGAVQGAEANSSRVCTLQSRVQPLRVVTCPSPAAAGAKHVLIGR